MKEISIGESTIWGIHWKVLGKLIVGSLKKITENTVAQQTDEKQIDTVKYSWIALYELAGFRQDKGLIWNFNEDVCILEVDIDPSFPAEEHRHNLIKEDFLGDKEKSTKEWVSKNYPPDLTSYLKIDTLYGEQGPEQGPWILLRGHMNQQNKQDNRKYLPFLKD